jgi:hypothetical protein
MLPLMPQLLVSTATALASWERHRNATNPDGDRASDSTTRGDASLRFVHFAGFWSHLAHDIGCSSWPVPQCTHIEDLVEFAEDHGALAANPLAGDVFLLGSVDANRHVLAGFVAVVERVLVMMNGTLTFVCITIEGEVFPSNAGEGDPRILTARLARRRLSPIFGDCFIRWCDLPPRTSRAIVEYEPTELVPSGQVYAQMAA